MQGFILANLKIKNILHGVVFDNFEVNP